MTFPIALSGLNAASRQLDVTANNIANVNTSGFKQARVEFADVFATASNDISTKKSGSGVQVASINQLFSQGNIDFTNNNLDMAISGEGFFMVKAESGEPRYTRNGSFGVDADGFIVNSNLERLQAYPATGESKIGDLFLDQSNQAGKATTAVDLVANLPATASVPAITTFNPDQVDSYNFSTSSVVYDSQGNALNMRSFFVKQGTDNSWKMYNTVDDGATLFPAAGQTLSFDTSGKLIDADGNGAKSFTVTGVPTGNTAVDPLTMAFNVGGVTQFGGKFEVASVNQDGNAPGTLAGIELNKEGVLSARFTNGELKALGTLAIATFSNPAGLSQQGNTSWVATSRSGDPQLGTPGTGTRGLIQGGALENANVDLTAQLVQMITAQRNFQANAQMISTSSQITQTILNLRN